MCGIIGYIGDKKTVPILIESLSKLEYRGYDSAGICILEDQKLKTIKKHAHTTHTCKKTNTLHKQPLQNHHCKMHDHNYKIHSSTPDALACHHAMDVSASQKNR